MNKYLTEPQLSRTGMTFLSMFFAWCGYKIGAPAILLPIVPLFMAMLIDYKYWKINQE